MSQPWEADDCADVRAYHTHYLVVEAAALWCGVPPERLHRIINECAVVGRAIFQHPTIPCIEPQCRAIHDAIESGQLECRREGRRIGQGEHVAPERRTVARAELKAWIAENFPARKPEFLFDEIERTTHSAITADAYGALRAECDTLSARLEKATAEYRSLREDRDEIDAERASLRAMAEKWSSPGERSEGTYQNIIAALLDCISGDLPGVEKHPSVPSEAKLIEAIEQHFDGYPGLTKSNLSRKFPEAKRALLSR